jgi:hypothetical protein
MTPNRAHFKILRVRFADVIQEPQAKAERVRRSLEADLDIAAMAQQVIPSLYRQHS